MQWITDAGQVHHILCREMTVQWVAYSVPLILDEEQYYGVIGVESLRLIWR